jgi:hypothetical protein
MDRHWCKECNPGWAAEMSPVRLRGFAKFLPTPPQAAAR